MAEVLNGKKGLFTGRVVSMYPRRIRQTFRCILDSPSGHCFRNIHLDSLEDSSILAPECQDTVNRLPSTGVDIHSRQAYSPKGPGLGWVWVLLPLAQPGGLKKSSKRAAHNPAHCSPRGWAGHGLLYGLNPAQP